MLKINDFIFQKIGVKLDYHKLKKYIDFGFIVIEKAIINLPKLSFLYFDIYEDMIDNEITLAGISKDKSVLHIGCGPIPVTSILLTKKTNAKIIGIDNNSHSIKKAKIYVKNSGFSDKIQIKHADAKDFPIENFDVIIVSQGVKPIKEILMHISKSMKDHALVIYRTSTTPGGEISEKDLLLTERRIWATGR